MEPVTTFLIVWGITCAIGGVIITFSDTKTNGSLEVPIRM